MTTRPMREALTPPSCSARSVVEVDGHLGQGFRHSLNGRRVDAIEEAMPNAGQVDRPCRLQFGHTPRSQPGYVPPCVGGAGRLRHEATDWRSSTSRVIRLADKSVALARSAIRNSRLGASERIMIVVYSLAVRPAPLIKSLSRCRGMTLTIRITARHRASSVGESGSTVAMPSRLTCFTKQYLDV